MLQNQLAWMVKKTESIPMRVLILTILLASLFAQSVTADDLRLVAVGDAGESLVLTDYKIELCAIRQSKTGMPDKIHYESRLIAVSHAKAIYKFTRTHQNEVVIIKLGDLIFFEGLIMNPINNGSFLCFVSKEKYEALRAAIERDPNEKAPTAKEKSVGRPSQQSNGTDP